MLIHKHPYVKFRRVVDRLDLQQKNIEEEFWIYLYDDRIVTDEHDLDIKMVFDISYKMLSAQYGFLYLHTTKGVITFQIKEDPNEMIAKFRTVEMK
ncbi:hypothetical protein [Alkalibacillus aidingensis]|uniref:hypothetical protein n=1 Tax=Alkalibacillus aidingensis TaxID=2747607 RepID=UPI0016609118|nr:hypothetical protein [Alkalibacillus aidingensis]